MIPIDMINTFFGIYSQDWGKGCDLFGTLLKDLVVITKDKLSLLIEQYEPVIINYLKEKREATTSTISFDLNIPYEDTLFVLRHLQKNKRIVMS